MILSGAYFNGQVDVTGGRVCECGTSFLSACPHIFVRESGLIGFWPKCHCKPAVFLKFKTLRFDFGNDW
jgi:hypothetical protein